MVTGVSSSSRAAYLSVATIRSEPLDYKYTPTNTLIDGHQQQSHNPVHLRQWVKTVFTSFILKQLDKGHGSTK